MGSVKTSLRVRLTLAVVGLLLAGLWALALLIAGQQEHRLRALVGAEQQAMVGYVATDIDYELRLRLDSLTDIAAHLAAIAVDDGDGVQAYLRERRAIYKLCDLGLMVVRRDGSRPAWDWPPMPGRLDHPLDDDLLRRAQTGPAVSDPAMDGVVGKPVLHFAVPIPGRDGVAGILVGAATIGGRGVLDHFGHARAGPLGDVVVVSPRSGTFVTGTDPSTSLRRVPDEEEDPVLHAALAWGAGSGTATDRVGAQWLVGAHVVASTGWPVVARLPAAEAFAPVREMYWMAFGGAAVLSLLVGLLTAWYLRAALRPMRDAAQAMDAISRGEAALHTLPPAGEDEIGLLVASFNRLEAKLAGEAAALQASEAKLRGLYELSPLGIALTDMQGHYIEFNEAFRRITGYPEDELRALDYWVLTPRRYEADEKRQLKSLEVSGRYGPYEKEYLRKDGSLVPLRLNGVLVSDSDGSLHIWSIVEDIAERRAAERHLKASEERYRGLIESQTDCIVRIDQDGRIAFANDAFGALLGLRPGQVIGCQWHEFIVPEDHAVTGAAIGALLTGASERASVESRAVGSAGPRWMAWEGAAVRDTDGRVFELQAVGRDVTERHEQAERTEALLHELELSNRELEQFAYVASHDLREPLRMVSAYVSLLERRYGPALDDEAREFIAFAKDGAARMDRMVLDLLDFSRVGRRSDPMGDVEFADILSEVMANLAILVEDTGAAIRLPDDPPVVFGSRGELVRLLQNLIGNAIKYRAADRPPEITVTIAVRDADWQLSVADNGIGIPPEHRERVFGIFQRLHTREQYEGTGIGLAVCRKVVEHHGGRIWIEDGEDARGCIVRFTLARPVH
ncbi:MAG: PAS domain S-box protein [Actinomycetota bacterium]